MLTRESHSIVKRRANSTLSLYIREKEEKNASQFEKSKRLIFLCLVKQCWDAFTRVEGGNTVDTIKVSAKSRSTAVAGAIAGVIRESRHAEVQAIGAGAVNQAIKAVAIARGYLAQDGLDIFVTPMFAEVDINGEERTAVKLSVESRPLQQPPPAEGTSVRRVTTPDNVDQI